MPRPKPLENLTSGRTQPSDFQSLTPRTPHTRSGRVEEAGPIELEQYDDDDNRNFWHHQSEPLLPSSLNPIFPPPSGYHNRRDDHDLLAKSSYLSMIATFVKRIPLVVGSTLAFILFVLIIISFVRPNVLRFIGETNITVASTSDLNIISYKNYSKFPLLPTEYLAECDKLMHGFMRHGAYWDYQPQDVPHGEKHGSMDQSKGVVCNSTITYMLGGNAGLLADLGLMSQVAALARRQNRTFLVDDTYWNRGNWTDHFQDVRARQPGPEPGCRAPPPQELVACPRTARHWIVNSRTAKYHFGHAFSDAYEDPYAHALNRWKPIFNAALESLTETIRPNAHNLALIRSARDEIKGILTARQADPLQYIGVHLRRGDRHAVSWRYRAGYVPIPEYVQAVQDSSLRLLTQFESTIAIYIASDSPSAEAELVEALPSNMQLLSLARSRNAELRILASAKEYVQREFDKLTSEERINLTRGMVVDFAMLSGMWAWNDGIIPQATVCTITSNVCKLSAVGLGWDRAFGAVDEMGAMDDKTKRWIEIDNAGQIEPSWDAFELFN